MIGQMVQGRPPLAINALRASGGPDGPAIDAFLEDHDFPLVEGTSCTFVYRGNADAVRTIHDPAIYVRPATDWVTLVRRPGAAPRFAHRVQDRGGTGTGDRAA